MTLLSLLDAPEWAERVYVHRMKQAAFRIAKWIFVVLFCIFVAAAGDGTRKATLTVPFHTFLPSETFGWAGFLTV